MTGPAGLEYTCQIHTSENVQESDVEDPVTESPRDDNRAATVTLSPLSGQVGGKAMAEEDPVESGPCCLTPLLSHSHIDIFVRRRVFASLACLRSASAQLRRIESGSSFAVCTRRTLSVEIHRDISR